MDQTTVKEKMTELTQSCACGAGKQAWKCCKKDAVKEIENEQCACGSGKQVKDCCMKSSETQENT